LENRVKQLELVNEDNLLVISQENLDYKQALERKEIEIKSIQEQLLNKDISIEDLTREHNNSLRGYLEEISFLKVFLMLINIKYNNT